MKMRPRLGLLILFLLIFLSAPPARAVCSFSYPVIMSGAFGDPPGFLILPDTDASLGGFLWDLGHGDPADGSGNDGNSLAFFLPNGTDPAWIERDMGVPLGHPEPTATIGWDWFNAGNDGCPAPPGNGVTVVYVLDDSPGGPHYALLAVAPTSFPLWAFNYDHINNGQVSPLTGVPNDVPLKKLSVGPELSNVVIIDASTMQADVASPTDSVNYYDDQGSAGPYPDLIVNEMQRLVARDPGGGNETEIPGCADGCQAVLLPRDQELCWDGQVRFAGFPSGHCEVGTAGGDPLACDEDTDCGYCELANVVGCIPGVGGDAFCASGNWGDCLQDTCNPEPLAFGPPVPGNCAEQGCLDTGPPTLEVTVSPDVLWPPNHRMVAIEASVTSEDECGAPTVELIEVSSDEPDDAMGQGDGATVDDIQGVETGSFDVEFSLRAERSAAGDGRVYTVVYRAVDGAGNQTTATSFVTVPRTGSTPEEPVLLDVTEGPAGTALDWDDIPTASSYRVVRGGLANIADTSGRYELGPLSCIAPSLGQSSTLGLEDPELPAQGAAFFYVVEYVDVVRSSFGTITAAKERWDSPGACP